MITPLSHKSRSTPPWKAVQRVFSGEPREVFRGDTQIAMFWLGLLLRHARESGVCLVPAGSLMLGLRAESPLMMSYVKAHDLVRERSSLR